jgi:cell division protein FtsI/penicillin-binding protein 2
MIVTRRLNFILLFFLVVFALLILRLFYWQIVRADELSLLGESQYGKNIKLVPIRGEIKTSDGYPIAANKLSYLVFANPKEIDKASVTARILAPILEMEEASISALLDMNRYWIALKGNINNDTKEKIEELDIKGIGFEERSVRYYPEASIAAKLLGFVGKNEEGDNIGQFGLEGYYDRQLTGKVGRAHQIHDALGKPILARMDPTSGEIDGRNLILNIDRSIQFLLDTELKKGIERYQAEGGMGAVMDPKTGKILAMSAYPSFDPSKYGEFSYDSYRNQFITDTYEPGSTFKPLVMAAAIESDLIEPSTRCDMCDGPVEIGGYEIKTWNNEYHPDLTMTDVIKYSDNTGMVFISQKLGLDKMLAYIKKFGFGQMTGIDLQGEAVPTIRPRSEWYPIDVATASFGQGISVTPIELLSAFSSIANNGSRMQPQVVNAVETPDGQVIKIKPKELGRPISKKTARIMTEVLVTSVKEGEAKWAVPKGYRIAGKTGTAQIPVEGRYDASKTIPSFIGFAPADDPKFIALIVLDRPKTSIYGSETAAPIFFKVATNILNYYGIPPTQATPAKE